MMDYAGEFLRLVRESLPGVAVYDGQPAEKLEDRPEVHVIVDINVPTSHSPTITAAVLGGEVRAQVRTIVRSGNQYQREDAAWAARWNSQKIRDYLSTQRLRPGGGLVEHVLQTGFVDDQAMVSHSNQIQVSQYRIPI